MYTPLELEKIEFEKSLGGYKRQSVDEVFDVLRKEYEELYKENIAYKDKMIMLEDLVGKYKAMEGAMNNALMLAQSAGDETINNAKEKANGIIRDAEFKAAVMKKDTEDQLKKLCDRRDQMARNLSVFTAKNVSVLKSQIELFKQLEFDNNISEDMFFNTDAPQGSANSNKE